MREGWSVPEEYKQPMINRQIAISIDPNSTPKDEQHRLYADAFGADPKLPNDVKAGHRDNAFSKPHRCWVRVSL
jgi:hypothetical protein